MSAQRRRVLTLYLAAENPGRARGPAAVESAVGGSPAEHLNLGTAAFSATDIAPYSRATTKEVFEVIRGWIEQRMPAKVG